MGSYMCAVVISVTLVYRVVTKTHDKAFLCGKKVLCSMAAVEKSVSNSQSLCNIH